MSAARVLLTLIMASGASAAWSLCIDEDKLLPTIVLNDGSNQHNGKIVYDRKNDRLDYLTWSSASLIGKTFVLYHLAARKGVDDINNAFISSLNQLPPQSHQLVIILNIDDVFTGGNFFARKTFEANAREHGDDVIFVIDEHSIMQQGWCINKKSSTVILVNVDGNVIKAKDGALTKDEILEYTKRIESLSNIAPGVN